MKTEAEIKAKIRDIESRYASVLTGSTATIAVNAPRALIQLDAQTRLQALHWVLGTEYKSKLKGVNT